MGCATSRPAPKPPAQSPPLSAPQFEQISKIKLVLLGDSGVGKSCLVQRYVRGAFDPASKITVGAAFQSHTVRLSDGKVLKLEIWDTAGQERYASLAPLYYRGAAAAIIVYDVTSKSSFAKAKHWISELHRNASDNLVVALVGNKTDLVDSREITQEDGQELADRDGMIFVETSARTAANCGQVFEEIAKAVSGYKEPVSTARSTAPQPEQDAKTIPVSSSGDKPEEAEDSPDASPEDESTDKSSDKK